MKLSHDQVIALCKDNKHGFEKLTAAHENTTIVLCPSFDALSEVAQIFKNSRVMIGAQNCSSHFLGNYTGQISIESLAQLGCHFCIVGHSECRQWLGETDQDVAQKIERLLQVGIVPLVCVGETKVQYEQHETLHIIAQQIKAALKGIKVISNHPHICIAYEPVWSIGTGSVPSNDHIRGVFRQITMLITEVAPQCKATLLYGGSVDENTVAELKKIYGIGGFLIGGASLDFQKFEKIVT